MNSLYYKPSGRSNPISFLYLLLAVVIAAPLLAFIYTYAILYIPIIYLNFLCLAGIALGLGYVANFVVGLGKVRNKILAILFGLIIGVVGIYISWVVWIGHHFEIDYMTVVTDMEIFKSAIGFANEQGTWGIGRSGGSVSGAFLSVVWGIELLAIIGLPIFFAYSKSCEPYIENDDSWAETTAIGPFEFIQNKELLKQQLENKKYEEFLTIQPAENAGEGSHAIFLLYHGKNRSQSKEFYLSVNNMVEKRDKEGKLAFDEKTLISFINISKEAGQQLLAKIQSAEAVDTIEAVEE